MQFLARASLLAVALGVAGGESAPAAIPTAFTRSVTSGHLIVDGRFIAAPFTLMYGLDPCGVYVGGLRITADPDLYLRLGYETEPPRVNVGGNDAFVADVVEAPTSIPERAPSLHLAARVTEKLAGWIVEGRDAEGVEAEFGRFLFQEADILGADIRNGRAELYIDPEGQTYLAIPIDGPALERVATVIGGSLADVARAAGEGAVFVNGRRIGVDPVAPAFREALVEAGSENAARWLRGLWGDALSPRLGAAAIRSAMPDVSIGFGESEGGDGVLVLDHGADRLAVVAAGERAPRVFDALMPFVSMGVAPSAVDARVRVRTSGFDDAQTTLAQLTAAAALRVDGDRVVARYADQELEAAGRRLWRSEGSLPPAAGWAVSSPSALVVPVPSGLLGVRWRDGDTRWRLPIGESTVPPVVTPDGKVAFAAGDHGALSAIEIRSGRVLWSVYPPARQPVLREGMPKLVPVTASNAAVLMLRDDSELLVFDRGSAAIRARRELEPPPMAGMLDDDDLLIAVGSQLLGFDRAGKPIASRRVSPVAQPTSAIAVGRHFVLDDGEAIRILNADLSEVRRLPRRTWGVGDRVLVVASGEPRVEVFVDLARDPIPVEVAGRPAAIIVVDDEMAWVACEGGLAYGVDLDTRRVRYRLDLTDSVPTTLRHQGVGMIGLTEEATLTGWRLD